MKSFNSVKSFLILALIYFTGYSCHFLKIETRYVNIGNKDRTFKGGNNHNIKNLDLLIIAFYNVENLFDTIDDFKTMDDEYMPMGINQWTEIRYKKKINDLAWVLSHFDNQIPAIIGLAEVENKRVVVELSETAELKEGNYGVIHEESPDTFGIDVALLYKKDIFQYISHQSITVTSQSNPDSKLSNILYVKLKTGTDTFHFFVNRRLSKIPNIQYSEETRIETARILKRFTDNLLNYNKNAIIMIMGDFNDVPDNNSFDKTLFATSNEMNAKYYEFYSLMYHKSMNGEGTISRNYKWIMADNILVSQALIHGKHNYVKNMEGIVFKHDKILYYNSKADLMIPDKTYSGNNYYGGYSDHLPVYFILIR